MPWATYRSNRVKFCSLTGAVRAPPPRHLVRFELSPVSRHQCRIGRCTPVLGASGRQQDSALLCSPVVGANGRQHHFITRIAFRLNHITRIVMRFPSQPHNEDGALLSVSRTKRKLCSDLAFRLNHISRIVFCFPYQTFRLLSWLAPASSLAR